MIPTLQPDIMSPTIFSRNEYLGSQERTGIQVSSVSFTRGTEHLQQSMQTRMFFQYFFADYGSHTFDFISQQEYLKYECILKDTEKKHGECCTCCQDYQLALRNS